MGLESVGKGQSQEGVRVSKKLLFLGGHPKQPPPQQEAGMGRAMPAQGLLNTPFVWRRVGGRDRDTPDKSPGNNEKLWLRKLATGTVNSLRTNTQT